jgi:anti-anti-sigma factor
MDIQAERTGETLIATTGDRVDGVNAREFQSELETAIEETDRTVILDLQKLLYISSAGLRVILLTAKALQRQQAKFAVCSLSDPVREIFEISGFDKIIPVHPTVPDALNALRG